MTTPLVSIVLPVYNRADIVARTIDSILGQTFDDWELLVVDDGSTDGSADVIAGRDSRIKVFSQENTGVPGARNLGLQNSSGQYITFMDSDDEWDPGFLDLTTSFLQSSPESHTIMTEFRWMHFSGRESIHFLTEVTEKYPHIARLVGSDMLDKESVDDPYLRFFDTREVVGPEIRGVPSGTPPPFLYRGNLFPHTRWGLFGWLPNLMLTRTAFERVGLFPMEFRSGEDYSFITTLWREYQANMIAIPAATKHERGVGGKPLTETHLSWVRKGPLFETNQLHYYDKLQGPFYADDPSLRDVRSYHALKTLRLAMAANNNDDMRRWSKAMDRTTYLGWRGAAIGLLTRTDLPQPLHRVRRRMVKQLARPLE